MRRPSRVTGWQDPRSRATCPIRLLAWRRSGRHGTTCKPVRANAELIAPPQASTWRRLNGSKIMKQPSAGYSGTPLVKKLGIKSGQRICIVDPPRGYLTNTLGRLPKGVMREQLDAGQLDIVHCFARSRDSLVLALPALRDAIAPDGSVWISWPKRASGVQTDLDGNAVRSLGLEAGLVDVKVCAIDGTWSGLKFVFRVTDR